MGYLNYKMLWQAKKKRSLTWTNLDEAIVLDEDGGQRQVAMDYVILMKITVGGGGDV